MRLVGGTRHYHKTIIGLKYRNSIEEQLVMEWYSKVINRNCLASKIQDNSNIAFCTARTNPNYHMITI